MNEERCEPSRCPAISKDDLKEMKDELKQHINDCVVPIRLTLYGVDGRNGVVGDVNAAKTSVGIVKWLAGTGLIAGLWGLVKSHLK